MPYFAINNGMRLSLFRINLRYGFYWYCTWISSFDFPGLVIWKLSCYFAEEPQGTNDLCPRLNGFYAHPEPTVCNVFYACVDGVAEEYTCSPGLYFDEYKGVCNWPLDSERTNCKAGT